MQARKRVDAGLPVPDLCPLIGLGHTHGRPHTALGRLTQEQNLANAAKIFYFTRNWKKVVFLLILCV